MAVARKTSMYRFRTRQGFPFKLIDNLVFGHFSLCSISKID